MENLKRLAKQIKLFTRLIVVNAICILTVFIAIVLLIAIIPYATAIYILIPLISLFIILVITFVSVLFTRISIKHKITTTIKKMILERINKYNHKKVSIFVSSNDDYEYIIRICTVSIFTEGIYYCVRPVVNDINEKLIGIMRVYLIV